MVDCSLVGQVQTRLRLGGCTGLRMLINKLRRGFWAFLVFGSLFMIAHFTLFLINQGDQRHLLSRRVTGNSTLYYTGEKGVDTGAGVPHVEPQPVDILPPEVLAEQEAQSEYYSRTVSSKGGLSTAAGESEQGLTELQDPSLTTLTKDPLGSTYVETNPAEEENMDNHTVQDGESNSTQPPPGEENFQPAAEGEPVPEDGETPQENPPSPPEGENPAPADGEPQPPPPEDDEEGENPLAKYGDPKNLNNRYHYPTAELPPFFKPGEGNPFAQKKSGWDYTNLLEVEPPPYLPNFRSPCWMEELTDPRPYKDNWMYHDFEYEPTYYEMEARWDDKLAQGQNWRLRCMPSFFVAGQAKCGTTELYDKIALHPQVVSGAMKEPHWWTRYRLGWTNDGYVPIMNYVDMYDKAAEQVYNYSEWRDEEEYHPHIFGDGSVTTLYQNDYWYDLPENAGHPEGPRFLVTHYIQHLLPNSRFLVMLRNPADRLYSDYLFFEWRKPKSVDEFHSFVVDSINKMNECLERWSLYSCVNNATLHTISKLHLRDGLYYAYLKEYYDVWPRDRIFVTRLEDYKADRAQTLVNVCKFLDLEPMPDEILRGLDKIGVSNARQAYNLVVGQMRDDTRKLLNDFHRPYNEKLAELLGEERFLWPDAR